MKPERSKTGGGVNGGLWLALALLVLVSAAPYLSLRGLKDSAHWRVHTYEVLDALNQLQSALRDVESSGRGFIISGRPEFLEPYDGGRRVIEDASATLERLTGYNALRRESLAEVRSMTAQWLAFTDETLKAPRHEAIARVSSGRGRVLMTGIRERLDRIAADERRLLRIREDRFESMLRWLGFFIVGASILAVSLVAVAGVVLNRRIAERSSLLREHELDAERLQGMNRELEAFSYSVSHDLRGPLRHIDGFVGLLRKRLGDQLDEKSTRYLDTIAAAARQMGRLIDDLLSFSKTGRHELRLMKVDLAELLAEVRQELAAEAEGREVEWETGPLPPVKGDAAMLRLALVNLVSNALKYTRPKSPAKIRVSSEIHEPGEVQFCISDNGVGFDMKYAGKLFGVFQRLHRTEDFEGTGIGLANVQRIIHRHGGRIWAESAPGEGAAFFFTLPASTQIHEPTEAHPAR